MRTKFIAWLVASLFASKVVLAATGGSVSMLDASAQPQYQVSLISPVNDGGGCDIVAVVMYDQTGSATDTDVVCVPLSGSGTDFTSWGSFESGYVPTRAPITYVLYDLSSSATACLADENSDACRAYTRTLTPLSQTFYNAPGLSIFSPPFSLLSGNVSIPTLSEWGILILVSLMGLGVIVTSRRRTC